MVVHIVMFQFKEENKRENLELIKKRLEELVQKIESLKSMEVGIDFNHSERAMDLSLYATFEHEAGLKTYATHPAHLEVVAIIKELTIESKVVDYII